MASTVFRKSGKHQIGAFFKFGNAVPPDAEFFGHANLRARARLSFLQGHFLGDQLGCARAFTSCRRAGLSCFRSRSRFVIVVAYFSVPVFEPGQMSIETRICAI